MTEKRLTSPFFVVSQETKSISSGESFDFIIDTGITGGDSDMLILIIGFPDAKSFDEIKIKSSEFTQSPKFFEVGDEIKTYYPSDYKITIPEFDGQGVFFRIVDEDYDTISKGIVETKMSIRYFDVKESGIYTMILTNLAQEKMSYEIEIGSTDANRIIIPAGIMFVGGLLLLFTSFMHKI